MENDKQQKLMNDMFSGGTDEPKEEKLKEETKETAKTPAEEPTEKPEGSQPDGEEQKQEEQEDISAEEEISSLFSGAERAPEEGEEEEEKLKEEKSKEEEQAPEELTDEDFEELMSSRTRFADYIKDIRTQAVEEASAVFKEELNQAKQEMLAQIPQVVNKASEEAIGVKAATSQFFEDYPHLKDKRAYVRDMVARVSTDKPEATPSEVLAEVGKRAERDFSDYKKAEKRETERKPRFAGAGGRRSPSGHTDTRSKQEKLMDETFS